MQETGSTVEEEQTVAGSTGFVGEDCKEKTHFQGRPSGIA